MFLVGRSTKVGSAVIALCMLALPVKAEEKVWYCEMTGLAETTIDGAETFKTQKFKMKVSSTEVVFGSGGFFNNSSMPIVAWASRNTWRAQDDYSDLHFKDGAFHYAQSSVDLAVAISARCDDF